jgi:uncharacterized protein YbjT (DUF2867 family)
VEVAVSSLDDGRGLRAALVGVDTIYHLAGGEWRGAYANLMEIDIRGTQNVVAAASDAGRRLFYVTIGADRASAYPVLSQSGAEVYPTAGINFTILRQRLLGIMLAHHRSGTILSFIHSLSCTGDGDPAQQSG